MLKKSLFFNKFYEKEKKVLSKETKFINGAHIDTELWEITNLDVKLNKDTVKELKLRKTKFGSLSVCLPITDVMRFGDVVTLKYTRNALKKLKECSTE